MIYQVKQKYTISNPPDINESSFIIEQDFLRHIKTEHIPNLGGLFNAIEWST